MSAHPHSTPSTQKTTYTGLGVVGGIVAVIGVLGGAIASAVAALALLGTPLFAIMGGVERARCGCTTATPRTTTSASSRRTSSTSASPARPSSSRSRSSRSSATCWPSRRPPSASCARRARSSGGCRAASRSCASSRARSSRCFTGGSGVTIIAIGGLLYPALRKRRLLGEVLARPRHDAAARSACSCRTSLPLLVYALVARVDFKIAFKAVIAPGLLVIAAVRRLLPCTSASRRSVPRTAFEAARGGRGALGAQVGARHPGHPRRRPRRRRASRSTRAPALVALYTVLIECFVYRTSRSRRTSRASRRASMALAGAVILILSMANALINYVVAGDDPRSGPRLHDQARARQDVAVPRRDERLPARARHADGGLQRDPRRGAAHPAVRGAVPPRAVPPGDDLPR